MSHSSKDAVGGHRHPHLHGDLWSLRGMRWNKKRHRREARREAKAITTKALTLWHEEAWELQFVYDDEPYIQDLWYDEFLEEERQQEAFDDYGYEDWSYDPFEYEDLYLSSAPDLTEVPTIDLQTELNRRQRISVIVDSLNLNSYDGDL